VRTFFKASSESDKFSHRNKPAPSDARVPGGSREFEKNSDPKDSHIAQVEQGEASVHLCYFNLLFAFQKWIDQK
jgi:hypothetical protein